MHAGKYRRLRGSRTRCSPCRSHTLPYANRRRQMQVRPRHSVHTTQTATPRRATRTHPMKKLLAALALLVLLPMSAQADYVFQEQYVVTRYDGRPSCTDRLHAIASFTMVIVHHNRVTGSSHCFLFSGNLRRGADQMFLFDNIGVMGGVYFGRLLRNPDTIRVRAKCQLRQISAIVFQGANFSDEHDDLYRTNVWNLELAGSFRPYGSAKVYLSSSQYSAYYPNHCASAA